MDGTATRLTLYAMLSAMEVDLRREVTTQLQIGSEACSMLPEDVRDKAIDRAHKDDAIISMPPRFEELLAYVDLGDLIQLLNTHKNTLPRAFKELLSECAVYFEQAIRIRNRVMHTRPLHMDDFVDVVDLTHRLCKSEVPCWTQLRAMVARLEETPGYVLSLEIPNWDNDDRVYHNLPIPEYDETGYIGREAISSNLLQQCQGPYPVITIVGEGGIGKTALALKAAYDLLDSPSCPFDGIIWSTCKTTQLTPNQIVEIDDSIKDIDSLFGAISDELIGPTSKAPFDEVLEFLSEFRILLILDNLETVMSPTIHALLSKLTGRSKILITSRIGLGAYEVPIKLNPLDEKEAV